MIRVLFVCLGNICRSPMAEAIFMSHVRAAGLEEKIEANSAGTGDWHVGRGPHPGTRRILERRGIPYSHRARVVTAKDLDDFDYVITMDEDNRRAVQLLGKARGKMTGLMEFAPGAGVHEVPDPYYTGAFETVYDLVNQATAGLLKAIREEHSL